MSFFHKEKSCLGVDLGAGGIKLVELRVRKGRPILWTYALCNENLDVHTFLPSDKSLPELLGKSTASKSAAVSSLPSAPGEDSRSRISRYATLLRETMRQAKITAKIAVASLPVSSVFHTIISLPSVKESELVYHIEAKIRKILPLPIDEMQVVHQIIPGADKAGSPIHTLVTAAPKSVVQFYTSIFAAAGLKLMELETEAFALERSLVGLDNSTAMIVDIGEKRTNFFIIDNGLPLVHRSMQMGGNDITAVLARLWGAVHNTAELMKQDLSNCAHAIEQAEVFAEVTEPIVKEISYSFDIFLHQSGNEKKRPEKIILTGGGAVFPPILYAIASAFPIKVFVGDPWARVACQDSIKPVINALGPRMSVCIGLALRHCQ